MSALSGTESGTVHRSDRGPGRRDRARAGLLVLVALVAAATVANLNLAVANVALPEIVVAGRRWRRPSSTWRGGLLGGTGGVGLYLGAVGDRYGRKRMLLGGVALSVPACIAAAWAPSVQMLVVARLVGGLAAGMAFPTTLALITALWSGPQRTRSIALWSGVGGSMAALGPLAGGGCSAGHGGGRCSS